MIDIATVVYIFLAMGFLGFIFFAGLFFILFGPRR